MTLSPETISALETFQRLEITEHHIYHFLAARMPSAENRQVLEKIAADELRHAEDWKTYTQKDIKPDRWAIWKYTWISRVFGITFGIKLMERGEEKAQANYAQLRDAVPEIDNWIKDENEHEEALLEMFDEEILQYAGSVVLGLNDALVELTGALAGLTLALQNTELIALSGLITGIAAAMSMAASEYLSTRSEKTDKHPVRAAVYTGIAYIVTVALLITPYLFIQNYYIDLALALTTAVIIIAAFNYYISIAKDEPFKARFAEMSALSFGIAAISFIIGYFIRQWLGIEV
ncbi:MAG: VIT1/CCC1 transporter family protein [Anaerolineales bacterium]|nr:VIT1/CCC1 transporter family protein [Chloroflexota bacterium]MBL7162637.1 VIT1/CCC1 transporter family protein [Anaerolineales bacterium]